MQNNYRNPNVYFDHNATTVILPEVLKIMNDVSFKYLNPSSIHKHGQEASGYLEQARYDIGLALDIIDHDSDVIFTSSATEGNNLVLYSCADYDEIYISPLEHSSIRELSGKYKNIDLLKLSTSGLIDLNYLEEKLISKSNKKILVSVLMVNNETGVIENIPEIRTICHKYGALLHSDCVQALGKIKFKIHPKDIITITSHKIGGPHGAAAVIAPKEFLKPFIFGGEQEFGFRAGTHNTIAIIGFAAAAIHVHTKQYLDEYINHTTQIRNLLEKELSSNDNYEFVGQNLERVSNTSMMIVKNKPSHIMMSRLDLEGFSVSNGSACSSGIVKPSKVLQALGYGRLASHGIRVSLNKNNTKDEMKKFINILK